MRRLRSGRRHNTQSRKPRPSTYSSSPFAMSHTVSQSRWSRLFAAGMAIHHVPSSSESLLGVASFRDQLTEVHDGGIVLQHDRLDDEGPLAHCDPRPPGQTAHHRLSCDGPRRRNCPAMVERARVVAHMGIGSGLGRCTRHRCHRPRRFQPLADSRSLEGPIEVTAPTRRRDETQQRPPAGTAGGLDGSGRRCY